jgi:hypothetical protein
VQEQGERAQNQEDAQDFGAAGDVRDRFGLYGMSEKDDRGNTGERLATACTLARTLEQLSNHQKHQHRIYRMQDHTYRVIGEGLEPRAFVVDPVGKHQQGTRSHPVAEWRIRSLRMQERQVAIVEHERAVERRAIDDERRDNYGGDGGEYMPWAHTRSGLSNGGGSGGLTAVRRGPGLRLFHRVTGADIPVWQLAA